MERASSHRGFAYMRWGSINEDDIRNVSFEVRLPDATAPVHISDWCFTYCKKNWLVSWHRDDDDMMFAFCQFQDADEALLCRLSLQ